MAKFKKPTNRLKSNLINRSKHVKRNEMPKFHRDLVLDQKHKNESSEDHKWRDLFSFIRNRKICLDCSEIVNPDELHQCQKSFVGKLNLIIETKYKN